jgi:hypothetical protein
MFASPNLVFHYIQQHHYLPPDDFIRAVLKEPGPSSPDYIARLKALSLLGAS